MPDVIALPTALVLLDYFGIAVFAIAWLAIWPAAAIAFAAGFALRGAAIAKGWSLPAYRD